MDVHGAVSALDLAGPEGRPPGIRLPAACAEGAGGGRRAVAVRGGAARRRFRAVKRGALLSAAAACLVGCAPPRAPTSEAVDTCKDLPVFENDLGADAVPVLLRLENRLSRSFVVDATCIVVDGRAVRQITPADVVAGFAAHRPLEIRTSLRPGVQHEVKMAVDFRGGDELAGFRLSVTSAHEIAPAALRPGTVVGALVERERPKRYERLSVVWTDPPTPQETAAKP